MSLSIVDSTILSNGVRMPWLGIGTWQSAAGHETEQSVAWALELGYRHIDTATLYANEADVGRALRASGIPRDQAFVTTKVWNEDLRQRRVREAFDLSLRKLGLDRVDLYLVHWPVPGAYLEAWRVLEDLLAEGRTRAIGVSNFLVPQLETLLAQARVMPAVNQVEWHPWLQQPALVEFCRKHGIAFQAWSPLMQGRVGRGSRARPHRPRAREVPGAGGHPLGPAAPGGDDPEVRAARADRGERRCLRLRALRRRSLGNRPLRPQPAPGRRSERLPLLTVRAALTTVRALASRT